MTELPAGWKKSTLGEECDLYQPKTISKKKMIEGAEFNVYGANGIIGKFNQYNHEDSEVLLSCRGNCGTVNVSLPKSWINGNAMVCKPKNSNITKSYLRYFLESVNFESVITGTAQQQITREPLSKVEIMYPPLPEQRKIIEALEDHLSRLDKVQHEMDCASARLDQLNLALLDKFFYQHDNLPGDRIQVGNLGKWITGSTPSSKNPDFVGTDFPFVTPGDVGRGGEISHVARTISNKGADSVRKIAPKAIQLVCIGATLGKVGITNFPCATNQQINSLQVDTSILVPEYGMWLFASPEFQQQLWTASSTTTVPNLNKGKLEKLTVRIPSIRDQVEILERFNFTTPLRERAKETITEYGSRNQSLKRSLLHAAFTGQLTNEVDIV
jgi:type I restriction enzyme S subunit